MTNSILPSIGSKIVWSENPNTIWVVDHHLPTLNQFEAHIDGNPLEGARFDLAQLKGAEITATRLCSLKIGKLINS